MALIVQTAQLEAVNLHVETYIRPQKIVASTAFTCICASAAAWICDLQSFASLPCGPRALADPCRRTAKGSASPSAALARTASPFKLQGRTANAFGALRSAWRKHAATPRPGGPLW